PKDVKVRNDAFKEVDRFINKANDHGLYVIIDMHGAPGSQNNQEHSGDTHANAENGDLWEDPNLQGKAKEIWWHISEKYK
ncbi:cellulase family glycosylhydrolase, partial [Staphylococcus epidermidis]